MEGRHCLSAATVISGLAGEVPSEAAAQESKSLLLISTFNYYTFQSKHNDWCIFFIFSESQRA